MKKWECTVCGYIHEGNAPPDECPLCGADSSQFEEIVEKAATAPAEFGESSLNQEPDSSKTKNSLIESATDLIVRFHLHPITVHAPNGIIPFAFLLILGAVLFANTRFDSAAFYCLVFVLLNIPFVLYTGYITWQQKYKGKMTPLFRLKIVTSVTATILLFILVSWKIIRPEVLAPGSSAKLLFLLLALLLLGAVGVAGHMGGKLVFSTKSNNN